MGWKTYLIMYFGSNGIKITDIVKKVEALGFKAALGPADFEYSWKTAPRKEEVFELGDKITEVLKGTGVMFNLDTHD